MIIFQVKENNYRGHGDSVDQLCWHPTNADLFVTASGDKTVRIWDVRTTKCVATVNTKGTAKGGLFDTAVYYKVILVFRNCKLLDRLHKGNYVIHHQYK